MIPVSSQTRQAHRALRCGARQLGPLRKRLASSQHCDPLLHGIEKADLQQASQLRARWRSRGGRELLRRPSQRAKPRSRSRRQGCGLRPAQEGRKVYTAIIPDATTATLLPIIEEKVQHPTVSSIPIRSRPTMVST